MDAQTLEAEVKALVARTEQQKQKSTESESREAGLVAGLIADFGLGQEPALRRALYARLEHIERIHGQKAELIIAEARSMAKLPTTKRPGNYFARAVLLKLREAGLV